MCGIVGYIGHREVIPVLIKGLEHLEYRGYDSAGVACLNSRSHIFLAKEKGKLSELKASLNGAANNMHLGIGHTRWATHGEPSQENAHPHQDSRRQIVLVHNGIVENYAVLKKELIKKGFSFKSKTDTEVAANLIGSYYKKGHLLEAVQQAVKRLHGFFAFVVFAKDEPDKIVVFKRSNPIVIGLGKNENFVASDVSALLSYTRDVIYLEDDQYAILSREGVELLNIDGKRLMKKPQKVDWDISQAQKSGFPHFMLKEIYEQPSVVKTILETRLRGNKIHFDSIKPIIQKRLNKIKKIHFVSCGTAYHAGLVGNYMMGECLALPCEATVSSEFRYEDPVVDEEDLVIFITQSGETADTLAALREAKKKKALTLAIVNVVGSTIAREADFVIYTHAGPEIGVASTKAYLAQLVALALFSIYLGSAHPLRRKDFTRKKIQSLLKLLSKLPHQIAEVLKQKKEIERCAKDLYQKKNFLYLGRGYNFPNALEGALKLKEITYAHAHGYPAGEMKHGPIALIDSSQPVICICPKNSKTYDKMISNIEEIRARKGIIISIATKNDENVRNLSKYTFVTPNTEEILSPILTAVPLQLFAYLIAVLNDRDVDQPRNLAKSVTVE